MMIKAQYIGPGYYAGIPARDLSRADWQKLTKDQQQTVADSNIYKIMPSSTRKAAKSGAEKPAKKN